jgi:hypothetical protein
MTTTRMMSKSPNAVARQAMATARRSLTACSASLSPKMLTQHQHSAIAALRQFFRVEYRGIVAILQDSIELRQVLSLEQIPHFSTLAYAEKRLFKGGFHAPAQGYGADRASAEAAT